MDTKPLNEIWSRLRRVNPWYFVVLAVVSAIFCVASLRANNLRMVQLRSAVYTADEQNGDTEGALRALREHVHGHMNTDLASGPNAVHPPVQLKFTYERLVREKLAAAGAGSSDIYTEAQQHCERTIPQGVSGGARLGCIQAYVKQRQPAAAPTVPKGLYQFDFVSPRWSPDMAGWSLAISATSLLIAITLAITRRIHRRLVT